MNARTLYTIGHQKKCLERFIGVLEEARADAVLDIRLKNTSQLAGYTKRDDLAFILRHFGIAYEHLPILAPTETVLNAYRQDRDWGRYERQFRETMRQRDVSVVVKELMDRYQRPCLLCAESSAERCHRRLIAERFAVEIPGIAIVHL